MISMPKPRVARRAAGVAFAGVLTCLPLLRCGTGGDISAVDDHDDPDSIAALDAARPSDTLRLATLNMGIGFPVAQLIVTDMKIDTVAYDVLDTLYLRYLRGYPGERVKAMARAIVAESLDVVGLQEVMAMRRNDSLVNDFLPELMAAIAAAGGPAYQVFQTVMNDTTLQGIRGEDTLTITFSEGHAVLVAPGIEVLDSTHIPYVNLLPIDNNRARSERGSDYLRLRTPAGVEFQVFNTHLEVFPLFGNRQASELVRMVDSLAVPFGPVDPGGRHLLQVVLGDLNAVPGTGGHGILKAHGFVDTWDGAGEGDGLTCCVDSGAQWDPAANQVDERIDYILARGLVKRLWSRTAVKEVYTGAGSVKLLASDHRMVVSGIVAQ